MESNTVSLIIEELANLKRRSLVWSIVPNSDSLINRASNNKILLDANIHSLDGSGMEWVNEILVLLIV